MYPRAWLLMIGIGLSAAACNGPFGLLPGGRLEGAPAPAPADWSFAGEYGTAQLETRPDDPYSVNLAFTVMQGELYVNAGDSEARWVKNLNADPRVRLRLDDAIYELRAERVTDANEIRAFGRVWTRQSMFRRDPANFEVAYLYRLVSR